jgi:hypothetical protein
MCEHILQNMLIEFINGTGLEVNAEKTKYMIMSRDQKAGQNINK